jgi:hypothetical protein
MDYRRHLNEIDGRLRNTELILSVPLRRDFSTQPAYWIEIYRSALKKQANVGAYFVVSQWGFKRGAKGSTELVQDHAANNQPRKDLTIALMDIKKLIKRKLEANWLLCESTHCGERPTIYPTEEESTKIAGYIPDMVTDLMNVEKGLPLDVAEEPATVGDRFKEAQKKRRSKSEW